MPAGKTNVKKLNKKQVDALKGKLLEVRKIGAAPILVECKTKDSVKTILEKADVPTDTDRDGNELELKIEAVLEGKKSWQVVELKSPARKFDKIAVTTKVRGAY